MLSELVQSNLKPALSTDMLMQSYCTVYLKISCNNDLKYLYPGSIAVKSIMCRLFWLARVAQSFHLYGMLTKKNMACGTGLSLLNTNFLSRQIKQVTATPVLGMPAKRVRTKLIMTCQRNAQHGLVLINPEKLYQNPTNRSQEIAQTNFVNWQQEVNIPLRVSSMASSNSWN